MTDGYDAMIRVAMRFGIRLKSKVGLRVYPGVS